MASDQGSQYHAFIESQLKAEFDRRATLDARGLSVVTTSGTLVTLVAAVAALTLGKDYKPSHVAAIAVGLTLASFIVAAGFGIAANFLRKYQVASPETLDAMLSEHWTDSEVTARNVSAVANVRSINSLRAGSNDKAMQVTCALACQLVGIASLAFAVIWELATHKY